MYRCWRMYEWLIELILRILGPFSKKLEDYFYVIESQVN